MANQYIGEIRIFPYNFAPSGWTTCSGQIMSISQNTALFSLLGTTYGGNGTSTFALPDLRGRVPVGQGSGPGLSQYVIGQSAGVETVALSQGQMPSHSHTVEANAAKATSKLPGGHVLAHSGENEFATAPDGTTTMNPAMIAATGSGQAHTNVQPYLALTPCIALQGIFPSRN